MAKYTCRVEADKSLYPVLLSNGNLISQGDIEVSKIVTLFGTKCPLSFVFIERISLRWIVGRSALRLMGGSIQEALLSVCSGGWTASEQR